MKTLFHLFLICTVSFYSSGQLILGGNNLQEIIPQSLAGSAVTISNITYQGAPEAISYFSANMNNMSIASGLLMTTGSKYTAIGPNDEAKAGVDNGYPGNSHPSFAFLFYSQSYKNCARIDFDLVPSGNLLKIKYQFGSEEYPESVGSLFSDAFAIYVMGEGVNNENIAKIGTNSYITTSNINNGNPDYPNGPVPASNPSYFIENGNGSNAPYKDSDSFLQYDGLTIPLTATTHVHPGYT
ncbi:choice-of-anchor L domain-containing protein, partial [Fluviicola sp.]|uniref:choice-of-anchor L domain-containing protein n=1 Tax=Fluviicola sp. TaxID=1917219 RepID=UPI002619039E